MAVAELYPEQTTALRFGSRYDRDLRVAIEWPHKLERRAEAAAPVAIVPSDVDAEIIEALHQLGYLDE